MPVDIYEFRIDGVVNGNDCLTKLHYIREAGPFAEMETGLQDMKRLWRNWVLPRLTNKYTVFRYKFSYHPTILYLPNNNPELTKILQRWELVRIEPGLAEDIGKLAEATAPSYVAVGFEKTCGRWQQHTDAAPFVPNTKVVRGAMRISGIPESHTVDAGDHLTDGALGDWYQSAWHLKRYTDPQSGRVWQQTLITMAPDGQPIVDAGPPATATMCYSPVTGFAPSRVISSQMSRRPPRRGV